MPTATSQRFDWRNRGTQRLLPMPEQEGATVAYACRLHRLTCLAPHAVAIVDGRQPKDPGCALE